MKNLKNHIKKLEEKLLHSDFKETPELLNELLCDDFEEISSIGKISSREEVVHWLIQKDKDLKWSLNDFRVKELSPELIIAIYHATKDDNRSGASNGSMRSSVWKLIDDKWKMSFHQATKLH